MVKNLAKNHLCFLERAFFRFTRSFLTDKQYARMILARSLGIWTDIDAPITFNQKLQWLKLYDRNAEYTRFADKYAVRSYVAERIGETFLNDVYFIGKSASDIPWNNLPTSFVIKCTHGSGFNIIVTNVDGFDKAHSVATLNKWLKTDYSRYGREWVYGKIVPRIMVEKFLQDQNGKVPQDYKVFCFKGDPRYIQVDVDRFGDHTRAYYDAEWRRQPFTILYQQFAGDVPRPPQLSVMLDAARKLAADIPFVRVDFYSLPEIKFGEMTFFPEAGHGRFVPEEWDRRLGEELTLPPPSGTKLAGDSSCHRAG